MRAARKEVARLERALEKLGEREAALHEEMAAAATDHVRLRELQQALGEHAAERERVGDGMARCGGGRRLSASTCGRRGPRLALAGDATARGENPRPRPTRR